MSKLSHKPNVNQFEAETKSPEVEGMLTQEFRRLAISAENEKIHNFRSLAPPRNQAIKAPDGMKKKTSAIINEKSALLDIAYDLR